jgi:ABC-type Fe3+-citrate transport system substrate-binding protein
VTFARQKSQFRMAVETMIAWKPERIILAHGRWYDKDGTRELRRAFRWVLN